MPSPSRQKNQVTVLRRGTPNESIGPIAIEAVNLPPGVMAPVVISEPTGSTAEKVVLKFSTEGAGFSGPIRIVGTASEPREIQRIVRTPEKFSNRFETIWLTAVAK